MPFLPGLEDPDRKKKKKRRNTRMCTIEELNLVFDETGKQFGYLTVRAEFAEMKEFKVK